MPASVTMKDDTPTRVTHSPCHAPIAMPPATAIGTASHGLTSCLTVRSANMTPTSATAEPTERSKLRVTISITALIAARLTIDVCSAKRTRLRCVRNVPLVAKKKNIQTAARTSSSIELRNAELLATRRRKCSSAVARAKLALPSSRLRSTIRRHPQEVFLGQVAALKFAHPASMAHHHDPVAGVDQFLDIG